MPFKPLAKHCHVCGVEKPLTDFRQAKETLDGRRGACKLCEAEQARLRRAKAKTRVEPDPLDDLEITVVDDKAAAKEADRKRRLESDYAPLGVDNYNFSDDGEQYVSGEGSRQKRQEYNDAMGNVADLLVENDPARLGRYMAALAEDERRFMARRTARSVSLAVARDALYQRQFLQAAREYLQGKVEPSGYALDPKPYTGKRAAVLLLTDLHFGSELAARDNPNPFMALEEARCFEKVVREAAEFKHGHRENMELVVLLGGDLIEGFLAHDMRAGAPLVEQEIAFLKYMSAAFQLWAGVYQKVRVACVPGNHGRDKLRHPGRATEMKWQGIEFGLYKKLEMMCSTLPNVSWDIPMLPVATVPLPGGHKLLLHHGDTEPKMGDPDTKASQNASTLNTVNATRLYGTTYDVSACGHFHKPRLQPHKTITAVFNGALVPSNGHARAEGYVNEPCGQWLFEAVEGYPVGDARLIQVGPATCKDEALGKLIRPFRFAS
jgi:predicted phosphodiesterase